MPTTYQLHHIAAELKSAWAAELAARFEVPVDEFLACPEDFLQFPIETVRVELMDGSCVELKYAFALVSEARRAIAVFTEHCGHHLYPLHEARVYVGGRLVYSDVAGLP
jgi:hypothetical protein